MSSDRSYVPLWVKSNYSFLEGASHPDELIRQSSQLGLPAMALTDRDGVYGIVQAHSAVKENRDDLQGIDRYAVNGLDPATPVHPPNSNPRAVSGSRPETAGLGLAKSMHTVQFKGDTHERPGGNAVTEPAPVDPGTGWGPHPGSATPNTQQFDSSRASDHDSRDSRRSDPRLIIGSEITVEIGPGVATSVVLLAENRQGYGRLCGLISKGRMRAPKGQSLVTLTEVCEAAGGLVALWNGRSVVAPEMHLGTPPGTPALGALTDAYAQSLYLITARHFLPGEPTEYAHLKRLSSRYRLPMVAATEVLYHAPEKRALQDVVTCIRHGVTLDEAGALLSPNASYSLLNPDEMFARYRDVPTLVWRTLEIGERTRFNLDQIDYRYPNEQVPAGYSTSEWLWELTFAGARKRYSGTIPPDVRLQLEKELDIIGDLEYAGYFLTMWEIVEYCRRKGILAQGRGSAANSAVCYCLHITAIDPVRMDLLFERFLSRERAEPPDIDIDIEHRRREEVIQHMYKKYGREKAAMVANIIRYRVKSSIRDVGKVLDFPATALDRMAKLASGRDNNLEEVLDSAGVGMRTRELFGDLVGQLLDFPRHLSIHPGGFLLGSDPVHSLVPIENATMPDRTVIQWDKNDVEEMKLFKVDLLGLGALTHLDYCLQLLKNHRGIDLSMATIPHDDPAVFKLICKGDTVGVFQLESRAQMAMLPRLRPQIWYDIVIEVSIVRPGPITGGMVHPYLRRRQGEEEVVYPHPDLEPVLKKTLGIPIFQEQVMKLAVVAADYTPGEADQLRRDMAAWRRSGRIEKHHARFVERMKAKGISEDFAEAVFKQIRGFGEYGFPESHAASFSLIAYCTAWMRAHYPAEFICGLLNAWPMGFYSPASIVEDAKRHNVEMRSIDVLHSGWDCTLEPVDQRSPGSSRSKAGDPAGLLHREDDSKDQRSPGSSRSKPGGAEDGAAPWESRFTDAGTFAVRMGMRYVKGINEDEYHRIVRARQVVDRDALKGTADGDGTTRRRGGNSALEQFIQASELSEEMLVALARAGAFESFGLDRRQALWEVSGHKRRRLNEERERARVGDGGELLSAEDTLLSFDPLHDFELVAWDHYTSSHSTQAHALEPHREILAKGGHINAREIWRVEDGTYTSYIGLVITRQRPGTAGGTMFITLEDETGYVNLVIWKAVYEKYRTIILTSSLLGVTGKIQAKDGVVHLIVEQCFKPQLSITGFTVESRDFR